MNQTQTRFAVQKEHQFHAGELKVGFDISALDAGFKAHAKRGIGRYVYELYRYFQSITLSGLTVEAFDYKTIASGSGLFRVLDKAADICPVGRQTIKHQILYPLKLGGSGAGAFDVMHFPAHMDAPAWGRNEFIVTVLDLIPLILEGLYKADKPGWRFRLARSLEIRAIKKAAMIIAISENTASDVSRMLGIRRERIVVTPLGVDRSFFKIEKLSGSKEIELRERYGIPLERKIVLYVGGIDPRKNCQGLISSFQIVCRRARADNRQEPVLVMAGAIKGDREYPRLLELIRENDLADRVVMPGYVEEDDLGKIYSISSVFFFPSLYEGFGLPPLEAMACGIPVVSSNTSSLPEVIGDAGLLVDPGDYERFGKEIWRILNNREAAQRLGAAGRKQASLFSWHKTGDATLRAYERFSSLLNDKNSFCCAAGR